MTVLLLPPKTCISSKGVIVNRRKKKIDQCINNTLLPLPTAKQD